MDKQSQHIIFDLDGTIIDSRGEILKTYKTVFTEIPPVVPPVIESLNFGLTINDMLSDIYGAEVDKIAAAKRLFVAIYDSSDYTETSLYEGVFDLLHQMKGRGHELYIATNKRLTPTLKILAAKKINHLFSAVMANEMASGITLTKRQMIAKLKELGSFSIGYMVGDSVTDIQAGKEEGLMTIAVNYGYERAAVLAALNPTFSTDNFQNLYTFVVEGSKQ